MPRPDDITFKNFFKSVEQRSLAEDLEISVDDFDSVTRETDHLLVQKRNVKFQRRREASRNPVKALAARSDIKYEYTEVFSGVAEREKKRLHIEKRKNRFWTRESLKVRFSIVSFDCQSTNNVYRS